MSKEIMNSVEQAIHSIRESREKDERCRYCGLFVIEGQVPNNAFFKAVRRGVKASRGWVCVECIDDLENDRERDERWRR